MNHDDVCLSLTIDFNTFAPPMPSMSKSTYVRLSVGASKCTELSVLLLNFDHKILMNTENWGM